ncbi:hypothetical protein [Methanocella conradii]|nr:hypothetical protein [Methanocella conradii]
MAEDQAAGVSMSISNSSTPIAAPDGITLGPLTLVLESHTYYPNDVVRAFVFNATDPLLSIIDPAGLVYNVTLARVNESAFVGEYALNRSIILDNYTVVAFDNATGASANDSFLVVTRPVLASPAPEPTIEPANLTNETTEERPLYLLVNTSKNDYPPMEQVDITVRTNAGTPTVIVQDPVNNTVRLKVKSVGNDTYSCAFKQDKSIVLGNYTVIAYVNENGVYNYTMAYFNVSMGVSVDKGFRVQYAAYDPVQKAIVVRANVSSVSSDVASIIKDEPKLKGMNVKGVKTLGSSTVEDETNTGGIKKEDKTVEVVIPVDNGNVDEVARQFNVTRDITKATTSVTVSKDGTSIHLSLNDKVDGCWYRMSAPVPDGYTVQKIVREDGVEIKNDIEINRTTGEYEKYEVNWYVENGTLYFYDDPINGYDITLSPPMANASLALNVITGGQLSAIVYPFNQSDSSTTIAANDHLGRNGDNNYGTNIDADAGSKTAVRMYNINNNNTMMFGNGGSNYATYSNAAYAYTDIGQPIIVGFNTVPDGSVESVIISNYRTPQVTGAPSYVNITQKTIIRNNNLWFATIYYINNSGANDINGFRFYQGCDFNFNGDISNDDNFYDSSNDIVYGYKSNANPDAIHVGGFRSSILSSKHDVNQYGTIWTRIAGDNLQNGTSTNGVDGGMAEAWDRIVLKKGETWVVPVIWGVGSTVDSTMSTINNAIASNVYDVGIKEITSPANGSSLDASTNPMAFINATVMDVGVTDQNPKVVVDIKNSQGNIVYHNETNVTLTVPYAETAQVSFPWDIENVTIGSYTINVYTQLNDSNGNNIDQKSSNDLKSIVIYISDFNVYPDQSGQVSPGENIFYSLTLSNMGADRTFDLNVSPSTAHWPTYLYYLDNTILLARDDNGDGVWDWVNNAYRDINTGAPCISLQADDSVSLLVQKLVPSTAGLAVLDTTMLKVNPAGQPSNVLSARLYTNTLFPPLAVKTFYMHSTTLNTTPESTSSATKAITSSFALWSQAPAFSDNFTIAGYINVPLYYKTSTTSSINVNASLLYTNGSYTALIGSSYDILPAATNVNPSLYTFNFTPISGNVVVPKGSYLILKIENLQSQTLTVYYGNTYRTCVRINTSTYVNVTGINTSNGTASTSNFNYGDTLYVTANVSDPIGAYDISNASISIFYPNGTALVYNQQMTYNSTDPSSPPLWKTFDNAPLTLSSSLPAGVYTINVTGNESNGVTHNKTIQFTLQSSSPAVSILPNYTKSSVPDTIWNFKHTVINLYSGGNDVFDISYTSTIPGWTVRLLKADGITALPDTDNDGIPDTGSLGPSNSVDIIVQVTVPVYASLGDVDVVNVTARSSNNLSVSSTAMDKIVLSNDTVVKTLYLHNNTSWGNYLNTSSNSSAVASITMSANTNYSWTQNPAFAKNFIIQGDPDATLYLYNSVNRRPFTISAWLQYYDGATYTTIGSWTGQITIGRRAYATLNFSIALSSSNVSIPAGSKLVLILRSDRQLTLYHSSDRPSHMDMDTQSYINVKSVTITDTNGIPISNATPPASIKVIANVTDPFGSYDIVRANLTIKYSNGTTLMGPLPMSQIAVDTNNPSLWKKFEKDLNLNTTIDTDTYDFIVTATESNGVTHNNGTQLSIVYPVRVRVTHSIAPLGGNAFSVCMSIKNNDSHTLRGVCAYDFYSNGFTVSDFSDPHVNSIPVSNGILSGIMNIFGPFDIPANQVMNITYTATGNGDYRLSDLMVVGVDPHE